MKRKNPFCLGYGEFEGACENRAGTKWGPYWCERCNKLRLDAIDRSLHEFVDSFEPQEMTPVEYYNEEGNYKIIRFPPIEPQARLLCGQCGQTMPLKTEVEGNRVWVYCWCKDCRTKNNTAVQEASARDPGPVKKEWMMDPWIDDVVFECGCCGMYVVLGTGLEEAPTFPYTYEDQGAVLRVATEELARLQEDAISARGEGGATWST